MTKSDIFAAATAFVKWTRPWTFYDTVMAQPALTASDRAVIEKIWLEVCGASHWQHSDLSQGCATANHALTIAFPWLPEEVRAQFVRAAAYEWRVIDFTFRSRPKGDTGRILQRTLSARLLSFIGTAASLAQEAFPSLPRAFRLVWRTDARPPKTTSKAVISTTSIDPEY